MAHIMRTEGVLATSLAAEDFSDRDQAPTIGTVPSMELPLAIAALRRGIDASAVDCTGVEELDPERLVGR